MDVYVEGKCNLFVMIMVDFVLKYDFKYCVIVEWFFVDFKEYFIVFVKVWFKFIYRDMGLKERYLGIDILEENFIW